MFESAPQSKCAVAYILQKPDGEQFSTVIVFSSTANTILRILRSDCEITQMCTPGDDRVLLCGTNIGSILLFDLQDVETSSSTMPREDMDYSALLSGEELQEGETNQEERLRLVKQKYAV